MDWDWLMIFYKMSPRTHHNVLWQNHCPFCSGDRVYVSFSLFFNKSSKSISWCWWHSGEAFWLWWGIMLWRFLDYEQSFFFLVRRAKRGRHGNDHARDLKARDGRGRKKERLPLASFLSSRGFAVRRLLARELPSLNLEKTRHCLQCKRFSSRVTILLHGRDFFSQSTNWLTRR